MEYNHNGIQPKGNTTTMEDNHLGKQSQLKTTIIKDIWLKQIITMYDTRKYVITIYKVGLSKINHVINK